MCGIAGIYRFDLSARVTVPELAAMCGSIRHRGPDDEGLLAEESVGIGMRRLSIIDLNTGHQPVFNEDQSLAIVFNGEIYNYRELRTDLEARGHVFRTKSDTETIVHLFEEYGRESVSRLNGMFAFVIFDRRNRSLFVARDQIGVKPLYYRQTPTQLIFASEIKALLTQPQIDRAVDLQALAEYMRFGYVSGDRTMFQGIEKVPAGHYMVIDSHGVSFHRYWSPPEPSDIDRGLRYYAEQVRETLKASVRRQLVSDVPLGAFLSGGMDSTSIVHMMRASGSAEVRTYSIGFGTKYKFHDELSDARAVAQHEKSTHHEIIAEPNIVDLLPKLVWHLDEPVADSSYIVTYLVSQLAAQSVKVILSGVGGDELFGGYRRYLAYTFNRYAAPIPTAVRHGAQRLLSLLPTSRDNTLANLTRLARSFLDSLDEPRHAQYASLLSIFEPDTLLATGNGHRRQQGPDTFAADVFADELARGDLLQQMIRYDMRHSLVDDLLLLTDKMTMACSLESRVPLLDIELVEAAFAIPSRYKVNRHGLRQVQIAAMKDLLPEATLKKKKKGFGCPVGSWVKGELREYIGDCLTPRRLSRHGLFNGEVIARTLKEHYENKADHTDQIMSLLTFEIWYDTFVQRGTNSDAAKIAS